MPRVAKAAGSTYRRNPAAKKSAGQVAGYSGYGGYKKTNMAKRSAAPSRSKGGMKYPGAGAAIGTGLGGLIGGPAGAAVGGLVGGAAHKLAHALFGFGDYQVSKNAILEETNGPPMVINKGKEFIIRHREYIKDIFSASGTANTPSAFALESFAINPGNFQCFPWLSTLADKFEQYRIEGMIFEYKSLYSDAVVTQNGSIGSTILATEYNSGAPAFTNKQQMENYQFAQSAKPSLSIIHPIECRRPQNVLTELYVRPGNVPAGEDVKTYDFGDFYIASQGIPLGAAGAPVNLGELWVSYQIALIKPRIPTAASTYVDSGWAHFSTPTAVAGGSFTGSVPVPTAVVQKRSSSNIDVNLLSNNVFTFNLTSVPMKYQVDLWWETNPVSVSGAATWQAPSLSISNGTFIQNTGTVGSLPASQVPTGGIQIGTGCALHYFINLPAATPSNPTATITVGSDGAFSSTAATRFNAYINAIPTTPD